MYLALALHIHLRYLVPVTRKIIRADAATPQCPIEKRKERECEMPSPLNHGDFFEEKSDQTTPRPSEHPPVMGEKMSKRLDGIKRLQIQKPLYGL